MVQPTKPVRKIKPVSSPQAIQQTQAVLALAKDIIEYLKTKQDHDSSNYIKETTRKIISLTLGRLLVNSEDIQGKEDELKREVSQSCLAFTESFTTTLSDSPLAEEA